MEIVALLSALGELFSDPLLIIVALLIILNYLSRRETEKRMSKALEKTAKSSEKSAESDIEMAKALTELSTKIDNQGKDINRIDEEVRK